MNASKILTLFYLLLFSKLSFCQVTREVNGTITEVSSGKIFLVPVSNSLGIYGGKLDSADIVNGSFALKVKHFSEIPTAYRFILQNEKRNLETGFIFLESKKQTVFIDSTDGYRSPIVLNSNLQLELKNKYEKFFETIVTEGRALDIRIEDAYNKFNDSLPVDSLSIFLELGNALDKRGDSLMLEYCNLNRTSYVALWKLIERFEQRGYRSEYWKAFHTLSNDIRETPLGVTFNELLRKAQVLAVGNLFPKLKLYEIVNSDSSAILNLKGSNKYTLINFWFSSCIPCIKKFPELKSMYNTFRLYGFEIIGVSVDRKQDLNKLKSVIANSRLPWPQYIDWGGQKSEDMIINSFPTTFLLDTNGVIIKKNIAFEDLKSILEELQLKSIYWNSNNYDPL
ncbi:MAG: AhpC/TSA family protein [Chitinophagaceae bacterium]|nr:AhpC/TSA family protein [Chitinophagaceae bacterium]